MRITKVVAAVVTVIIVCSLLMVSLANEVVEEMPVFETPVLLETPGTVVVVSTVEPSLVDIPTPPVLEVTCEPTAEATAEPVIDVTVDPTPEVTPTPSDVPDEQVEIEALPTEEALKDLSGVSIALHYLSGSDVSLGDTVTMFAEITGLDGIAYTIQWQYCAGGAWHDLSGANGNTCQFTLTLDSATYVWRVLLTVG